MNKIIKPGSGVLFMKIGTHANETLADIIARKEAEIRDAGFGMWGYGGNTCHPSSMVQPFAKAFADRGPIYLCMEAMESNHFAEGVAAEYSLDSQEWMKIPDAIEVRGSKYAMIIEDLHQERFKLPLDQTRVPVGPSLGRLGSRYVKGRVDKACLEILEAPELANDAKPRDITIDFVARTRAPYAVFLRGQR
ncbi:MAG: hypothetical protein BGN86_15625 [Caulobacterales bacterium 68-7]|nr:MAG: hypothetical protein BGN86_15625 [Caulobacterales bacterium 68-7]